MNVTINLCYVIFVYLGILVLWEAPILFLRLVVEQSNNLWCLCNGFFKKLFISIALQNFAPRERFFKYSFKLYQRLCVKCLVLHVCLLHSLFFNISMALLATEILELLKFL